MKHLKECNLCGSNIFYGMYYIDRFKRPFQVVRCTDCGLVFMNPQFEESELKSFYDKDYYSGDADYSYNDERKDFKGHEYVWKARIRRILKSLGYKNGNGLKLLDVGCSFGGFLKTASRFGFETHGIDISEYAVDWAKENLSLDKLTCGKVFDAKYPDSFFDVVTMIEVIEHVDDPKTFLNEVSRILKPGGLLVLQTANMNGQQAKREAANYHYFLPGHLFYFSDKTISQFLIDNNFGNYKIFYGVDFGLLPKLLKSRRTFKNLLDYFSWIRIILYHIKSFVHFKNFALTSSMVVYTWKKKN